MKVEYTIKLASQSIALRRLDLCASFKNPNAVGINHEKSNIIDVPQSALPSMMLPATHHRLSLRFNSTIKARNQSWRMPTSAVGNRTNRSQFSALRPPAHPVNPPRFNRIEPRTPGLYPPPDVSALPSHLSVRAVRFHTLGRGCRTEEIMLVPGEKFVLPRD